MSSHSGRSFLAGAFIIVGVLLLLSNLDFIEFNPFDYLFRWETILIVVGLFVFLRKGDKNGIVLIAIGGFFLTLEVFSNLYVDLLDIWPIIFIIIGIAFINQTKTTLNAQTTSVASGQFHEIALFGGNHLIVESDFKGGILTNVFGGSTIDLRKGNIREKDEQLNLFILFGASKIMLPNDVDVNVEINPVLGELRDRRVSTSSTTDKRLNIRGTIVFGGGEIVN